MSTLTYDVFSSVLNVLNVLISESPYKIDPNHISVTDIYVRIIGTLVKIVYPFLLYCCEICHNNFFT